MYPIDLVKYTNTKKKIPTEILTAAAEVYPNQHKGLFKSYFQDGVAVLWVSNFLGQMMLIQFSSYVVGPMQLKVLMMLPTLTKMTMSYAPVLGCLYFAFSYYLNHGQTLGLFRSKKKIHFETPSWKQVARYSVYSSLVGCFFGVPLLSKKFINWSEKTLGLSFRPHDDLYHELFIPKNEWVPSLVNMTLPELPVTEIQDEDFIFSQAA